MQGVPNRRLASLTKWHKISSHETWGFSMSRTSPTHCGHMPRLDIPTLPYSINLPMLSLQETWIHRSIVWVFQTFCGPTPRLESQPRAFHENCQCNHRAWHIHIRWSESVNYSMGFCHGKHLSSEALWCNLRRCHFVETWIHHPTSEHVALGLRFNRQSKPEPLQTVPSPLIQLNLHHSYGKYIFLLRLVSSMCYTLYLTGFFNTPIWRLICFPWFTVGFWVVDGFLQVSSFRWIHCFHYFILMNSPFRWSHVFLSLGLFSCWDRLDEFIVFVNCFDE